MKLKNRHDYETQGQADEPDTLRLSASPRVSLIRQQGRKVRKTRMPKSLFGLLTVHLDRSGHD
jgi:hypothetical protein